MMTDPAPDRDRQGWVSSAGLSFMADSTKNWEVGQWRNHRIRITSGLGEGNEQGISGNNANTVFVPFWPVGTPNTTSKYEIMDSFGIVTSTVGTAFFYDGSKNWRPNVFAGKRLRVVAGGGMGNEVSVTSNSATGCTLASAITGLDATSVYQIFEVPPRSTGTNINWLYGLSNASLAGRFLITPRGGASPIFDIYDIPSDKWYLSQAVVPQSTTLTTGSMYCYDGGDSYLFTKDATGRVYELDLRTFTVHACGTTPYVHGTAVLGNRMEIIEAEEGLKYLYIMRHSGQEMWRTLKFW
jgi:hypothetical protein